MSAVREVASSITIHLRPKQKFAESIPALLLEFEDDIDRAASLWQHFRISLDTIFKTTRYIHRLSKDIALDIGIEKSCTDISRRLVNVNVHYRKHAGNRTLHIHGLTPIPEECLNVEQYLVATIPEREPEAEAQLIGHATNTTTVEATTAVAIGSSGLPTVQVLGIAEASPVSWTHGMSTATVSSIPAEAVVPVGRA